MKRLRAFHSTKNFNAKINQFPEVKTMTEEEVKKLIDEVAELRERVKALEERFDEHEVAE